MIFLRPGIPLTRRYLNDGDASGGGGDAAPTSFASEHEAVAELDRREAAREEQARAETESQEADERPDPANDDEPDEPDAEGQQDEVATDEEAPEEPETPAAKLNLAGNALEIPKGTSPELVGALQEITGRLNADYTRKTQEVAQERQQVQAVYRHTQEVQAQMRQMQQAMVQFHQQEIGDPPDPALIHTDPQSYLLQNVMHQQKIQRMQQLMANGQQMTQQQAEQQKYAMAQHLEKANADLLKQMPELSDPSKRQAFSQRAVEIGSRYGITAEEIATTTDPRMVLMLRDLDKYHAREASAGDVRKKLANVPPKVQKPGTATRDQGAGQRQRDALGQFRKSAMTMEDARRYIERTS